MKKPKLAPVNNLVVVSDTHGGCQFGLCPPEGARLTEGGGYHPNALQKVVWSWWEEFWGLGNRKDGWVQEVCRGEPFAVAFNGDALDGVHHDSVTQWTHNLADQEELIYRVLRPIVDLCEGRYYHLTGTEAHSGKSGQHEEQLARRLGAISDETGRYSRYELWVRVGRGLAHLTHHIGVAGSMHYESTALMRELTEAYVESGRWNNEAVDWVCRSHRHRNAEVRVQTHKGFATVFTTAAWQLRTPFSFRIAGARQSLPQIGGSLMRCGDEDLFTRHRVWSLKRPRVEIA